MKSVSFVVSLYADEVALFVLAPAISHKNVTVSLLSLKQENSNSLLSRTVRSEWRKYDETRRTAAVVKLCVR